MVLENINVVLVVAVVNQINNMKKKIKKTKKAQVVEIHVYVHQMPAYTTNTPNMWPPSSIPPTHWAPNTFC